MHALSLALLVVAAQAGSPESRAAATPVPAAAPVPAQADAPPAPLPRAAVEKLAQGDRAFVEKDHRGALFAYLDAAYLAPTAAAPRVKLGRAYLALRHPARALEQAEKALALEPGNVDATKLAEESRAAAAQAAPGPAQEKAGTSAAPRVFRYAPEGEAPPLAAGAPSAAAAPAQARPAASAGAASAPASPSLVPAGPAPAARAAGQAASAAGAAVAAAPAIVGAPEIIRPGAAAGSAAPLGGWAAQRYRQGLDHIRDREFDKAVAVLTEAVALDPRLAVAYAARASARFALGTYRDAADDYRKALELDSGLATPLYGLAECHRVLGQRKEAIELYQRYADSRSPDARADLRDLATKRIAELR